MEILKLGLKNEFSCKHSGSYIDPITNKIRQFDLQFEKHFNNFHIFFAIECKNINEKFPLLISQTLRKKHESYHEILKSKYLNRSGTKINLSDFENVSENKTSAVKVYRNNIIYQENKYVGKSVTQLYIDENGDSTSKNEEVYEKWIQVFGQANGLVNKAANIYRTNNKDNNYSAIFPILIIPNERLWVVNYNLDGNIKDGPKKEISSEIFYELESKFKDEYEDDFIFSHLHIFTIDGFKEFLKYFEHFEEIKETFFTNVI